MIYRRAAIDEIIALRHAVLRAGLPREKAQFAGDDELTTVHVGAFADDLNIACASFMLNEYDGFAAYQLRGMATHPDHRRRGVGAALLCFACALLAKEGRTRRLWCNARVEAAGFYARHGWAVASEPYMIEGVGMHVKMTCKIARA